MKRALLLTLFALSLTSPALALRYYLTAEWYENGDHMCKYSNNSVLNMGYRICPLSVEG